MLQKLNLLFPHFPSSLCWLLLLFISACASFSDDPLLPRSVSEAPSLILENSPNSLDYDAVQHTLISFLDAWKAADFEAMYSYLTPNVQQSLTYPGFLNFYNEAHRSLTLQSIDYQLIALAPQNSQANSVVAIYQVTFETSLVGNFTDEERQLTLSLSDTGNWGIDWRPGLIFAEMDDSPVQPAAVIFTREMTSP